MGTRIRSSASHYPHHRHHPGKNIVLDCQYTYDTMDNILSKQTGQGIYHYTGACPECVEGMRARLTDVQVDIPDLEHEGFSFRGSIMNRGSKGM